MNRRRFFTGLAAAVAAPLVVRDASILMPVQPLRYLRPPPPPGYIYPDGQLVLRAHYPELWAALAHTFADPQRPAGPGEFRIPRLHPTGQARLNDRNVPTHMVMRAEPDDTPTWNGIPISPVGIIQHRIG